MEVGSIKSPMGSAFRASIGHSTTCLTNSLQLFLYASLRLEVVYVDIFLFSYKSGVYKHVDGEHVMGHCIRLIGWGVEKKVITFLVFVSYTK